MGGFLVTLVVLGLVAWGFLRLLSLGTVQQAGAAAAMRAALALMRQDVLAATLGPLDAAEAILPLGDNVPAGGSMPLLEGGVLEVAAGTDQLELVGMLRSAPLPLSPCGASGRPGAGGAAVRVAVPRRERPAAVEELVARLHARPHDQLFFVVSDAERRWAVARVASYAVPGACGGADLVLDFASAEAVRRGPRRDPAAAARLGELRSGGLLDRQVYFLAAGGNGAPPALCVAEDAGTGRYRVTRLAEGVEDLQVAYGIASADGRFDPGERAPDLGPDDWWPDHPGEHPATAEMLRDALGRPRLRGLKVALVGARAQHAGEPPKPMNRAARGERLAAAEPRARGWTVESATFELAWARDRDP